MAHPTHRRCEDCGVSLLVPVVGRPPMRCASCRQTQLATRTRRQKSPEERAEIVRSEEFWLRFMAKVKMGLFCWVWSGSVDRSGYGKIIVGGRLYPAHRVAYEVLVGVIPVNWTVSQTCDNRRCVRPDHLEANPKNARRAVVRTHCHRGHEFTIENTYIWDGQPSMRHCVRCRLDTQRKYELAKDSQTIVPFTRAQKRDRMAFYHNLCWMCGAPGNVTDHVKPISKGGLNILSNMRPSCKSCNPVKGDRWPFDTSFRWRRLTTKVGASEMRKAVIREFPISGSIAT